MTGEVEAEQKGPTKQVTSVAFAQDGNRVACADDSTIWIWNMIMDEVEAELSHGVSVSSIAFSHDGSQVVFGSDSTTVQIWNTMTNELQLMTTPSTTITLPDASIVHNAGVESYPEQPTLSEHGPLSISDDRQWIVVGALHDCWIPSHNRDFISVSFSGDRVCLGCHSGHMIIFDMKAAL